MTDRRPESRVSCDVLVVGGGAAGVAAAVAAARRGREVILLERYGFCGGGAVAGMSGTVCGLYAASAREDARPEQLVFGFADEFASALARSGGLTDPVRYGKTFTRVHDPLVWREVADRILQDAGVRTFLHTLAIGVGLDGGERVTGVTAYTKAGPLTVDANVTIDASGDADIVSMAGFETTCGNGGKVQNPTMMFRMQGVDVERFRSAYGPDTIMGEAVSELIYRYHNAGVYRLPRKKVFMFPTPRPGELLCNATRIMGRDGNELNCVYADDITEAEIEGRKQVREYARFSRDHLSGCESAFVNDTGVQVGVRQTRQIVGATTLANSDVVEGAKFSTGIARSAWPIELHSGDKPKIGWLLDDYYEVPFGCFLPVKGEGLLVAGRCLAAEHEAMASARVTAQCFSYGQAIGIAAAMAAEQAKQPRDVRGEDVRAVLNSLGAKLD